MNTWINPKVHNQDLPLECNRTSLEMVAISGTCSHGCSFLVYPASNLVSPCPGPQVEGLRMDSPSDNVSGQHLWETMMLETR